MKKYFCFHCQKEIEPYKIFIWRICPMCHKIITDNGDGFYRVCDSCGANMPVNGKKCLKCGYNLDGKESKNITSDILQYFENKNLWKNRFLSFCLLIGGFFLVLSLLYLSFYIILFGVIFAVFLAIIGSIAHYFR